jgi:hypothetical protein
MDASVLDRLENRGARAGLNKSRLAERYIDEGIRIEDHPGIVFRDGPAGRRPGLAAGPDVWEVVGVLNGAPERGEAAIRERDRDVIAVAEHADLRGTPDEELLTWAQTDDRALVTDNQRDFIPIHHRCAKPRLIHSP